MHKFRVGDRVRIVLEGDVSRIDEDGVHFIDQRTGEDHYWEFSDIELALPPLVCLEFPPQEQPAT